MDRLDVPLRTEPQRRDPSEDPRAPSDPERALWSEFAEAQTAESFCRSWLALQCRMISGVSGGLLLLGAPDRGPFAPAAIWPSPRRNMKYLTRTAERALVERRGLLVRQESNGTPDGAPAER